MALFDHREYPLLTMARKLTVFQICQYATASRPASAFESWRIGAGFPFNCQVRPNKAYQGRCTNVAPVVALSADAQESTKQLCLSSGMNGFFTKPMKKGRLIGLRVVYVIDERTRGPIDSADKLRGSFNET